MVNTRGCRFHDRYPRFRRQTASKRLKGDATCFVELLGWRPWLANRILNKNPSDHNPVVGHVGWHYWH
jgi:hypothetical protein